MDWGAISMLVALLVFTNELVLDMRCDDKISPTLCIHDACFGQVIQVIHIPRISQMAHEDPHRFLSFLSGLKFTGERLKI